MLTAFNLVSVQTQIVVQQRTQQQQRNNWS